MATYADIIGGLRILAKYEKAAEAAHIGGAEHDVIYAGPNEEDAKYDDESDTVTNTAVSAEDAKLLIGLGWHIDSDTCSWARFV